MKTVAEQIKDIVNIETIQSQYRNLTTGCLFETQINAMLLRDFIFCYMSQLYDKNVLCLGHFVIFKHKKQIDCQLNKCSCS